MTSCGTFLVAVGLETLDSVWSLGRSEKNFIGLSWAHKESTKMVAE